MARWKLVLLVAGALLVAGVVLIVMTLPDGGPSTPANRPTKPTGPPPIAAGAEYVAIGDSATGAPGNSPVSADDGCLQSTNNYPHRVAAKLGLKLTDVSCGGATTQQVRLPQPIGQLEVPPQIDAVTPTTELVTLSLGANDFGTFGSIVGYCTAVRSDNPTGAPCEADELRGLGANEEKIATIEDRLVRAIRLVEDRAAPDARIIVVGYPEFFPEAGPCTQLSLAVGDYAFAHRINELLIRAQKQAAERTRVEFLDIYTPTQGHNMCADDPWIAGAYPTRTDAIPFHPYPEEQQVVAKLLIDRIT